MMSDLGNLITRIVRELPHCRCDPSVRMADAVADVAALLNAIDALHQPDQRIYCSACCDRWPCRTARLLHPEVTE